MSNIEKVKNISREDLLNYSELFRNSCNNIPVCNVVSNDGISYKYIPLPVTDGPMKKEELDATGIVPGRALLDLNIDLKNTWAITEADRGGGLVLRSLQQFTGINVHWLNWYDEATVNAFTGDFVTEEMAPAFAMGSSLRPGLYMPAHIREILQKNGVVLIDDVLSTGTTIVTIKSILDRAGIVLKAVVCAAEKVDYRGIDNLKNSFPSIPVITMAKIRIRDFTEQEKSYYSFNKNFTGMSEITGDRKTPYYIR
ncbi:MAG: hypothetical protein ABRQ38_25010 [Candidatus Eremiobacterota bacterium]